MKFGSQTIYCANCGKEINMADCWRSYKFSICKDKKCLEEIELKYTRMIIGKNEKKKEKE